MIEFGRLLSGAAKVNEGASAETWKGLIDTAMGQAVAYIKLEPPAEMIADAVGAIIGRRVGLPIPQPFWVLVDRRSLPYSACWKRGQDSQLAFALLDARGISFKQWFNRDSTAAAQALLHWDRFQEAAIFDEWIANTDRNLGNLLYDGEIWLIDHGHALTGPSWTVMGLDRPELPCPNLLLQTRLNWGLSEFERYQWRRQAAQMAELYAKAELGSLQWIIDLPELNVDNGGQVIPFLQSRATALVELLCQKLGIPELPLQQTSAG